MVISYANPFTGSDLFSRRYVYPFFQQSWNLFVPTPANNYRLFVEFECGGIQRYDLFEKLVSEHQSNRLRGYESLVLAFSNSIFYVENDPKWQSGMNGPIRNDLYFSMLEHSSRNYLRQAHKCKIDSLKLILMIVPLKGSPRVYFN